MPPSRRVLAAIAAAALIGAGASAAPASAATVQINVGCVIFAGDYNTPAIPISGTGFSPNSSVTLSTITKKKPTPTFLDSAPTNAAGAFSTVTGSAIFNSFKTEDQKFTLVAVDSQIPQLAAVFPFRQVRAGYIRVPDPKRPGQKVKHIAKGFTPGKTIYAHFRHKSKTRANKSLGKAQGPCGIATRRMRALPTKSRLGNWTVFVDESKSFSRKTRPQARLSFTVFRRFF